MFVLKQMFTFSNLVVPLNKCTSLLNKGDSYMGESFIKMPNDLGRLLPQIRPWTASSCQDKTWAEFSTLEVTEWMLRIDFATKQNGLA
jgi:hypothetical protein